MSRLMQENVSTNSENVCQMSGATDQNLRKELGWCIPIWDRKAPNSVKTLHNSERFDPELKHV